MNNIQRQKYIVTIIAILFLFCGIFSLRACSVFIPLFIWAGYKSDKFGIRQPVAKRWIIGVFVIFVLIGINILLSYYQPNSVSLGLSIALLLLFDIFVFDNISRQYIIWIYRFICLLSTCVIIISLTAYTLFHCEIIQLKLMPLCDMKFLYKPFGCPINEWGTLILVLIPFNLYSYFIEKSKLNYLMLINIALLSSCIALSYCRSLYGSLFLLYLSVLIYVVIGKITYRQSWAKLIFLALAGFLAPILIPNNAVITTLKANETVSQQRSIDARIDRLDNVINYADEHRLYGYGLGNYLLSTQSNKSEYETLVSPAAPNTFIQIYIETGYIGFGIFTILLLGLLSYLFYHIKAGENIPALLCSGTILAFLFRDMAYATLLHVHYVLILSNLLIVLLLIDINRTVR